MSNPTVRPKSFEEDLEISSTEEGLSLDPDELGSHFLKYATEQGDADIEPGDVPLPPDADEEPIEEGGDDGEEPDDDSARDPKGQRLNLLDSDIHDASLFDDQDDEEEDVDEIDAKVAKRSST